MKFVFALTVLLCSTCTTSNAAPSGEYGPIEETKISQIYNNFETVGDPNGLAVLDPTDHVFLDHGDTNVFRTKFKKGYNSDMGNIILKACRASAMVIEGIMKQNELFFLDSRFTDFARFLDFKDADSSSGLDQGLAFKRSIAIDGLRDIYGYCDESMRDYYATMISTGQEHHIPLSFRTYARKVWKKVAYEDKHGNVNFKDLYNEEDGGHWTTFNDMMTDPTTTIKHVREPRNVKEESKFYVGGHKDIDDYYLNLQFGAQPAWFDPKKAKGRTSQKEVRRNKRGIFTVAAGLVLPAVTYGYEYLRRNYLSDEAQLALKLSSDSVQDYLKIGGRIPVKHPFHFQSSGVKDLDIDPNILLQTAHDSVRRKRPDHPSGTYSKLYNHNIDDIGYLGNLTSKAAWYVDHNNNWKSKKGMKYMDMVERPTNSWVDTPLIFQNVDDLLAFAEDDTTFNVLNTLRSRENVKAKTAFSHQYYPDADIASKRMYDQIGFHRADAYMQAHTAAAVDNIKRIIKEGISRWEKPLAAQRQFHSDVLHRKNPSTSTAISKILGNIFSSQKQHFAKGVSTNVLPYVLNTIVPEARYSVDGTFLFYEWKMSKGFGSLAAIRPVKTVPVKLGDQWFKLQDAVEYAVDLSDDQRFFTRHSDLESCRKTLGQSCALDQLVGYQSTCLVSLSTNKGNMDSLTECLWRPIDPVPKVTRLSHNYIHVMDPDSVPLAQISVKLGTKSVFDQRMLTENALVRLPAGSKAEIGRKRDSIHAVISNPVASNRDDQTESKKVNLVPIPMGPLRPSLAMILSRALHEVHKTIVSKINPDEKWMDYLLRRMILNPTYFVLTFLIILAFCLFICQRKLRPSGYDLITVNNLLGYLLGLEEKHDELLKQLEDLKEKGQQLADGQDGIRTDIVNVKGRVRYSRNRMIGLEERLAIEAVTIGDQSNLGTGNAISPIEVNVDPLTRNQYVDEEALGDDEDRYQRLQRHERLTALERQYEDPERVHLPMEPRFYK